LLASGTLRAADVDELEDHLRQEIERLSVLARPGDSALSSEEVFVLATRRLGRTEALAKEFAKSDPGAVWRRRWIWMLAGYLGFGLAASLISTAATIAYSYMRASSPDLSLVLYAAIVFLGVAGIVVLARFLSRDTSTTRVRTLLARGLDSKASVVTFTLLFLGLRAAILPVGLMLQALPDGTRISMVFGAMWYSQIGLWLVPCLALSVMLWLERDRFRCDADSSPA
jgi:hypothetical protein